MDPALQEQLLQQLNDIAAPNAISWWPLAPGWWLLIILVLLSLVALAYYLYAQHRASAYRREALSLINNARMTFATHKDAAKYLSTINEVLKRISLHTATTDKPETAHPVSGQKWLEFLARHSSHTLSKNTQAALCDGLYRPNVDINVADIHQDITQWVNQHSKAASQQVSPLGISGATNA